jgi:hypothetical protein
MKAMRERDGRGGEQRRARRLRLYRKAENVLEVGQAVIAAEAHLVAEEGKQQRIGQRLGDDRQVDAGDAAAESEPAEHEGERAGHSHDHQRGEPELVEAVPVPRQFLPVQEHHEVRQDRVAVDAARADLAHQIHAHRVAAEREERAVAEREDAAIAPDEIERERQHGIGQILAEKRHDVGRHMQRMRNRQQQVRHRHQRGDRQQGEPTRKALRSSARKRKPEIMSRPTSPSARTGRADVSG